MKHSLALFRSARTLPRSCVKRPKGFLKYRRLAHSLRLPFQCPYGLYAEQLSGTAFTVPRARNQRVWLYRIRPSVVHERFVEIAPKGALKGDFSDSVIDPNQMRWRPLPLPAASDRCDFVDGECARPCCVHYSHSRPSRRPGRPAGLATMLGAGDPMTKSGMAVHSESSLRAPSALPLHCLPYAAARLRRSVRVQRVHGRHVLVQLGRRLSHRAARGCA